MRRRKKRRRWKSNAPCEKGGTVKVTVDGEIVVLEEEQEEVWPSAVKRSRARVV